MIHPPQPDSSGIRYEEIERQRIVPLTGRGLARYRTISYSFRRGMDTLLVERAEVLHWRPGRQEQEAVVSTRPHRGLAEAGRLEASLREKRVSFGGVECGDTLLIETRRLITRLPLADMYCYTFFAGGRDSVATWSFSVTRPSGTPLRWEEHGPGDPELSGGGNWETLSWRGCGQSPVPLTPMSPLLRSRTPRVVVACNSPEEVSRALWGAIQSCLPEDNEGARAVLDEAGEDPEELRRWVADEIEYLGADWGLSPGYSPRDPRLTLRSGAGVCRDKAVLLVWLLRAAGREAVPALASFSAQIDGLVGSRSFDHMVALVGTPEGWRMLDPAFRGEGPFPYELRGRHVLPLTPAGSPLQTFQAERADTLLFLLRGSMNNAGVLHGSIRCRAMGAADQVLRSIARSVPEARRGEMLALLAGAEPDSSHLATTDPDDLSTPFAISGEAQWRVPVARSTEGLVAVLPGAFRLDRLAGHQLIHSLVRGYLPDTLQPDPPLTLVVRLDLALPGPPVEMPGSEGSGIYHRSCRMQGDSLRFEEAVDLSPPGGRLTRRLMAEAALLCRDPAGRKLVLP